MLNMALILLAIVGFITVSITSLVEGSAFAAKGELSGASEFSPGDDYKETLTKDEGASEFTPGHEALREGIIGPQLKIK